MLFMRYMKVTEAALYCGVTDQTIRNWANTFSRYLSVKSRPLKGGHRQFEEGDMRVLLLVKHMGDDKKTTKDILDALGAGERAEFSIPETALISNPRQVIERQRQENQELKEERDQLLEQARNLQNTITPLEASNQVLTARLTDRDTELAEIKAKLADVEKQLFEIYAKGIERGLKINLAPPSTPKPDAPPGPGQG